MGEAPKPDRDPLTTEEDTRTASDDWGTHDDVDAEEAEDGRRSFRPRTRNPAKRLRKQFKGRSPDDVSDEF